MIDDQSPAGSWRDTIRDRQQLAPHLDLSDRWREEVERDAEELVAMLKLEKQSLGIARECWINAFDRVSARMSAGYEQ